MKYQIAGSSEEDLLNSSCAPEMCKKKQVGCARARFSMERIHDTVPGSHETTNPHPTPVP